MKLLKYFPGKGQANLLCLYCLSFMILLIVPSRASSQSGFAALSDIDGNQYKTTMIGDQVWMTENLRVTKFNDGTPIPMVQDEKEWVRTPSAAYSWYDNNVSSKTNYGGLYNWYSVETGKLCPQGWAVPTDQEWTELFNNLVNGWEGIEALESLGFTLTFGGYRYGYYWGSGIYYEEGSSGYWWTSTPNTDTHIWTRTVSLQNSKLYRSFFEKNNGFSVRCIKCE